MIWRSEFSTKLQETLKNWKIAIGEGDDYTTGCLLDYSYFIYYDNLIVIDLSKQQKLDADPKAIQQINFTGNLDQAGITKRFSLLKKQKKQF